MCTSDSREALELAQPSVYLRCRNWLEAMRGGLRGSVRNDQGTEDGCHDNRSTARRVMASGSRKVEATVNVKGVPLFLVACISQPARHGLRMHGHAKP